MQVLGLAKVSKIGEPLEDKRLERAGEEPITRTPVVLAADEFRDIAQLRVLRTILSQARKYGLYLWMVAQTLSEIPDDLMGYIQSNVGSVLAFRSSPDDSKKLAKLLYPQKSGSRSVHPRHGGLRRGGQGEGRRRKRAEPPTRVTFLRLKLLASFGGSPSHRGGLALLRGVRSIVNEELAVAKGRGIALSEGTLRRIPLA
ncbi:MAG: TraM recognition domain-containing protein [Nitrososphaerota archaeon]|nr:TraM recognition domain-containing protein [Nitrososphaerota archaeon]